MKWKLKFPWFFPHYIRKLHHPIGPPPKRPIRPRPPRPPIEPR